MIWLELLQAHGGEWLGQDPCNSTWQADQHEVGCTFVV